MLQPRPQSLDQDEIKYAAIKQLKGKQSGRDQYGWVWKESWESLEADAVLES